MCDLTLLQLLHLRWKWNANLWMADKMQTADMLFSQFIYFMIINDAADK